MKRFLAVAFFLVALFFILYSDFRSFSVYAREAQESASSKEGTPASGDMEPNVFKNQETVKFGIFSGGVRVGSGQLSYLGASVSDGNLFQHIRFQATTFSVVDHEDVYGTSDFASPARVERYVKLLGRKERIVENYARDARSVIIKKNLNGRDLPAQKIASPDSLRNVLLFLYKIRNERDLKVGSVFKIALPTQKFDLIVREKRKIRVPLGLFEAFYLESRPAKYRIWLSTARDRVPLRIQGLVAGGGAYLAATEII